MTVCLVHPPFAWPITVPLGLAYLKAYLQRECAGLEPVVLDLNNRLFHAPERLVGLCALCPRRGDPGCVPPERFLDGGRLARVHDFFHRDEGFYDAERQAANGALLRQFASQVERCGEALFGAALGHPDVPLAPALRRLLAPDLEAILALRPELVGFSAINSQIGWALGLARLVKAESGVPVVLGGYFVSAFGPTDVMQTFPFLDYVINKEGERGLAALVAGRRGGALAEVPGLVYRDGSRIVANPEGCVERLDDLPPPDFGDLRLEGYFNPVPVAPVLASRGCYWCRCAFCAHRENYARRYRVRSADDIVAELAARVAQGVRHFLFVDEAIVPRHLRQLATAILDRGLEVRYGVCGLRPARSVTRETLALAHASGCRWIYFGVESLTQRLLDLMDKGTQLDHVLRILGWCRELGIEPFVSYFVGFPSQTAAEVRAEARLCREHPELLAIPDDGGVFYLARGSKVHRDPARYGVEVEERISFASPTGMLTSIAPAWRPRLGLTGNEARRLFVRELGAEHPYTAGGYWTHLLLDADRGVRLTFPRARYAATIAPPLRPLAGPAATDVAGARLELAHGAPERARELAASAVAAGGGAEAHLLLVAALERCGRLEEALASASAAQREFAGHPGWAGTIARLERKVAEAGVRRA
jgi:hypothetical protein